MARKSETSSLRTLSSRAESDQDAKLDGGIVVNRPFSACGSLEEREEEEEEEVGEMGREETKQSWEEEREMEKMETVDDHGRDGRYHELEGEEMEEEGGRGKSADREEGGFRKEENEEGQEQEQEDTAPAVDKSRESVRKANVQTRINSTVRKQLADLMVRQNSKIQLDTAATATARTKPSHTNDPLQAGSEKAQGVSRPKPRTSSAGTTGSLFQRTTVASAPSSRNRKKSSIWSAGSKFEVANPRFGEEADPDEMPPLVATEEPDPKLLTKMISVNTVDSETIDLYLSGDESDDTDLNRVGSNGSQKSQRNGHESASSKGKVRGKKHAFVMGKGEEEHRERNDSAKGMGRMTSFMMNVSKFLSAYQKKTLKQKDTKSLQRQKKREQRQSLRLGDLIHYLPRGGVYVMTSIGPIQFGMPPETVKDSMEMGLRVPSVYVVPRERFNLSAGVNVCEIEFPAFFNFFVLMKSTTLVTHRDCFEDLKTILREALNGPSPEFLFAEKEYSSFCPEAIKAACPNHPAEIFHFRAPNRVPGTKPTMLDIDMLLNFEFFDENGMCDLGEGVFVFDDQENARFELQDEKMQSRIGFNQPALTRIARSNPSRSGNDETGGEKSTSDFESVHGEEEEDEEDELEVKGIIIPYRDAESCTVSPSAGLVPKVDIDEEEEEVSMEGDTKTHPKVAATLESFANENSRVGTKPSLLSRQRVHSAPPTKKIPPQLPVRPKRKSLVKIGERDSRREATRDSTSYKENSSTSGEMALSRPHSSARISTDKLAAVALDEAPPVPVSVFQWRRSAKSPQRNEPFQIPKFGLTVLGNSHGFDPAGSTSGFVLWINGQGVMVDPPPHSTSLLLEAGIQPNAVTAAILTHCHADHDAGMFQKMITENKVTLMTTSTIFESFKRKYAAVSGLKPEFIHQLVNFRPMFLEEPNYWNGASFRFFYSLHSIPCVGFQVMLEGKSIVYSGDTFYDPPALMKMHHDGILSKDRLDALLNFPWHCDIVLHEAGVPPIHTPIEALSELPKECRKNIRLIHIDKRAASRAATYGLQIAKQGIENTMVLIPRGEDHKMLKFLQLVGSMEIFRHFAVQQALDLMLMSREAFYTKGSLILRKGTVYDRFMIILQGRASVQFEEVKKFFRAGDYLGELAAWHQVDHKGQSRTPGLEMESEIVKETVLAETDVKVMEIDKYALNYLLLNDPILRSRIETMVHARVDGSWEAISSNTRLRLLSSMQKTQLQALLSFQELRRGDVVWTTGDPVSKAVLISRGEFIFEEVHGYLNVRPNHSEEEFQAEEDMMSDGDADAQEHAPLSTGMLLFDYFGFHNQRALTTTLVCKSKHASIFWLTSDAMVQFLDRNPMILLTLLKSPILT